MNRKLVTVFGGTGFLGRHTIQELARQGYAVQVITRNPKKAYFLKPYGSVGQIVANQADLFDTQEIEKVIKGSYAVINTIGILFEKGKNNFTRTHIDIASNIAQACKNQNIEKFIHISALGIEISFSKYAKTKLEAENKIKEILPSTTIFRPSVIFGKEDNFFNKFASMPVLPLVGGGKTKLQPVYVGDVASAIVSAVKFDHKGQTYELGGTEKITLKDIYKRINKETKCNRPLIPAPFWITKIAAFFACILPVPPITPDQVTSLKTDNTVSTNAKTFKDLGIEPKTLDAILPTYLYRYAGSPYNRTMQENENLI